VSDPADIFSGVLSAGRADALIYAKALSTRTPGTHSLHLIEGADHNFMGHHEEIIGSVVDWWELRQRQGLQSGIWLPNFSRARVQDGKDTAIDR
jgi:alpha/beta superfamily hydrolase